MITLLFFAKYREQLNVEEQSIQLPVDVKTVKQFKAWLISAHSDDPQWQTVLTDPKLIQAVNQTVVDESYSLKGDEEIAFFPPVTGG